MKKTDRVVERDTLRSEYTRAALGRGVRGKYAGRMSGMAQVVVLEPDVAKAFPNAARVNKALRTLMKSGRKTA